MNNTLYYLFDPLCGWCYGATPSVSDVIAADDINVVLLPSGLFSGRGGRQMDHEFAAYAWSNDQRIERLTGQLFTQLYRDHVLSDHQQRFDSSAATLALTAVSLTAPADEFEALKAIQYARYVQGRDVTSQVTLVEILQGLELTQAAELMTGASETLIHSNRSRISQAQTLMQKLNVRGVPTFIAQSSENLKVLSTNELYANPSALAQQMRAL
ncbi:DsbA family protein [Vreelandella alkaliphila]|uniref:DsbA family protein n=1 Tax=Vreelandella alkaliphila TaxID=272774 RepID=UPI003FD6E4E4